jgi:aryl-alcohol dehydrogenase-like predicted oxidoreductase
MYFGTRIEERAAFAILDRYAELGGQWLDTSNNYSFWAADTGFGGQSEVAAGPVAPDEPGRCGAAEHQGRCATDPARRIS